jgi:hypothetical protein
MIPLRMRLRHSELRPGPVKTRVSRNPSASAGSWPKPATATPEALVGVRQFLGAGAFLLIAGLA